MGSGGGGTKAFLLRVTLSGSQEEEICLFSVIFRLELQEAQLHYLVTATATPFKVDSPKKCPFYFHFSVVTEEGLLV